MSGTVYLVGAGCGDRDLITVRGMALLQQAEAVVYDALTDAALLDAAPPDAKRIYVGKRAGAHSAAQEEIDRILIDAAGQYRVTVRLKGGDPFVFGRGGEEALALAAAGIPYEVVPGISSCIAAPELAGIPVTHRGIARSLHVITAHAAGGWQNAEAYAKLGGTLVFLMGLGALPQIAADLMRGGMPAETPAAVISKGGTAAQQTVRGTLSDIADRAADLQPPAVIVVGETAAMQLISAQKRPLEGLRAALTGTPHFTEKLAAMLCAEGADARTVCSMELIPKAWSLRPYLDGRQWLVLTSANGVTQLMEKLHEERIDIRRLPEKIAVLGTGTAAALEAHGILPLLMPETFTAETLGKALAKAVQPGERVLILRAEQGSRKLTDALDAAAIAYDDLRTYDVRQTGSMGAVESDVLIFASASGVRAFFTGGGSIAGSTHVICIGQITAEALAAQGIRDYRIAAQSSAQGILDTILEEVHHGEIQTAAQQ